MTALDKLFDRQALWDYDGDGPKLPPGSSETSNGPGGTEAPPEFGMVMETTGDPSLGLRADAATAVLELFGFNKGQERGPDGKWIKMGGAGSAGGTRNTPRRKPRLDPALVPLAGSTSGDHRSRVADNPFFDEAKLDRLYDHFDNEFPSDLRKPNFDEMDTPQIDTLPVKAFPIADLIHTQDWITPIDPDHQTWDRNLPVVYRMPDGSTYLLNGHHRVMQAILRGDETIEAREYSIENGIPRPADWDFATATEGAVFGFNPHQLRGPDGKFIKMPASQLRNKRNERARARRAAKKAEKERAAGGDSSAPPNVARDGYNSEILDRAGAVSNALRAMERPDRELEREIDKLTDAMGSDNPRDADKAADRVRERMEAHGDLIGKLRPAPDGRGTSAGKIESDAPDQADAAHRRARDGFNRQVLAEAQNVKNDNEFDGADDAELELQIDQLDAALADGDTAAADDWADALHSRMADKYPDAAIPAKPQPPAAANSVEIDETALQQRFKDALDDYNAEIHVMGKAWVDMLRDPEVRADPDSGLDHVTDEVVNELGSNVLALRKAILNSDGDMADLFAAQIRRILVSQQLQADHDFPQQPTIQELRNEAIAQARNVPVPPSKTSGLLTSGAPVADRIAALRAAAAAGTWGEEPIGQGAMGETKKVVFNDGTRAVYKKAKGDWGGSIPGDPWTPKHQTDAEEMASLVGAALGLRAPAVQRISDDEINMELVENAGPAMNRFFDKTAPDYVRVPGDVMGSDDGLLMGLFDTLIDNPDRHGFNWMIDDQNRVFPIDHGLSFMNVRGTPNLYSAAGRSPFATEYFIDHVGNLKENILSRRDIAYVRQQLAPLEAEFERVGRPGWYRVMQMRLDAIERRAKGGASHQLPAPRQEP